MKTKNYWEAARNMIRSGAILQANGATVGKYQAAVPDRSKQFLVTGNGPDAFFYPAQDAVDEFVTRVGQNSLVEAVDRKVSELNGA